MTHILGSFPQVMGVVNVTPDSFSDGGTYIDPERAVAHGLQLLEDGADILDIGGESTRPGANPVSVEEELERVVPVIEGLAGKARWISIDTRNSRVMEAAIEAGANIINDVSGLTHDARSAAVAAVASCPVILMHSKGSPVDMQENPNYNNVVREVYSWLESRIKLCETHRIDAKMLVVDPGIGFGKMLEHNLLLLRNIKGFSGLGVPIMLGTSRKSFIADICGALRPDERIGGSLSSVLWGLSQGVQLFRVHDVAETRQAVDVYQAILSSDGVGAL